MREIPDYIIHYSRSEPFRSMTSLSSQQQKVVINELDETTAWGLARFSDPEYLTRRLNVERYLREQFILKGGTPELGHPIYFFLGRHPKFEEHESNKGYILRLSDIPAGSISFTYGDSMFCFNEDYRRQIGEPYQNPLCNEVYRLADLPDLFLNEQATALNIEAQLWCRPPLV